MGYQCEWQNTNAEVLANNKDQSEYGMRGKQFRYKWVKNCGS